jgi:hypothetical protein
MEREALRRARRAAPLAIRDSLAAAGLDLREPHLKERALPFDRLLQEAEAQEAEGNAARAAWIYEETAKRFGNRRWMSERAARALYRAGGRDGEALDLCRELNRAAPTVATLLLEARLRKRADQPGPAVDLLERARAVLEGKGEPCN